jgi:TRAP transporter 4TM/12TM fusion protein
LSGSAISNVVSTGSITIPMMIRTGYKPHFAAAVEACASNGGQIMPPVMGAVAFVMASFLNVHYLDIALAATIPSLLYFFSIYVQVDGYAVKNNLRGLAKDQLPSLKQTFKEGWYYLFALVLLIVLLWMDMEIQSPYYTSAFLVVVSFIKKRKFNFRAIQNFFVKLGEIMSQLVPMLGAVGMIMGALGMTGIAHAFPSELLRLAGHSLPLMLMLAALASFVMGMGMTAIAVYVFLAVILAPAMIEMGLYPLAVHMFLLYWGILSFITPPVCIAVYPAALIAGANSMRSGFAAMRLGITAFIIPFFFVLDPSLIFYGTPAQIAQSVFSAFIGVFVLASAIEGYMIGFGKLGAVVTHSRFHLSLFLLVRGVLMFSGFLICLPGTTTDLIGIGLVVMCLLSSLTIEKIVQKGLIVPVQEPSNTTAVFKVPE